MSDVRRAYDLLRGYVGREWDRIKDIEWAEAAKELLLPPGEPAAASGGNLAPEAPSEPAAESTTDYQALARQILGVTHDADFATVRQAFEKLNARTNPSLFPTGSDEAAQAAKLREKVTWAYQLLSASADQTQKRFGSLEIE